MCNAPRSHPETSHGVYDPEGPQANPLLISVPVHCIISEINMETSHKVQHIHEYSYYRKLNTNTSV